MGPSGTQGQWPSCHQLTNKRIGGCPHPGKHSGCCIRFTLRCPVHFDAAVSTKQRMCCGLENLENYKYEQKQSSLCIMLSGPSSPVYLVGTSWVFPLHWTAIQLLHWQMWLLVQPVVPGEKTQICLGTIPQMHINVRQYRCDFVATCASPVASENCIR